MITEAAAQTARDAYAGTLPMTARQTLDALAAGVMRRAAGGFTWTERRVCTDCPAELNYQIITAAHDDFPRCSRHAF